MFWSEKIHCVLDHTDLTPTNEDEERLVIEMFRNYNHLIRPSPCHNSSIVYVEFGMAMILLINVDEKNQIMQTNVWLTFKWNDCQFSWVCECEITSFCLNKIMSLRTPGSLEGFKVCGFHKIGSGFRTLCCEFVPKVPREIRWENFEGSTMPTAITKFPITPMSSSIIREMWYGCLQQFTNPPVGSTSNTSPLMSRWILKYTCVSRFIGHF